MLSGRLSFTSQGAKHGVMSVGMPIKGSGKGGRGRGDNGWAVYFRRPSHDRHMRGNLSAAEI